MATTKIDLTNSNNTKQTVTATPTASAVPIADATGKIGDGWVGATTAGDIIYSDGTDLQRLGVGTAGQILQTNSGATAPEWGADISLLGGVAQFNSKTFYSAQVPFLGDNFTNERDSTVSYNGTSVYMTAGTDNTQSLITNNGIFAIQPSGANPRPIQFSDGKKIIVEFLWGQRGNGTEQRGFGLSEGIAPFQDYDDQTDAAACFTIDTSNNLYAHTADAGTGHTETAITGVTLSQSNTYRIEFDPGVDVKFYVNGTLEATITTNLPDSGTVNFGFGSTGSTGTSPQSQVVSSLWVAIEK